MTARRVTGEHLKDLRRMTQALYDLRIRLRDAQAKNQAYVRQLRQLEEKGR